MNPFGLLISAVGLFAVLGGLRDWPWFWNSGRAQFVTFLMGRRAARIFYVTIGIGLIVLGVWASVAAT